MIRKSTTLQAGKIYSVNNNGRSYTIILGDLTEISGSTPNSSGAIASSLKTGVGSPSHLLGVNGDIYVDVLSKKVFTRDAGGWDSGLDLNASATSPFQVGNGSPSSSLAASVNAYVDLDSMMFHTRSAGNWDSGRMMRGSAGQNGKSIRFGNGSPIASLGNDDEAYLDLSSFKIHTKLSGSWTAGQIFRGNDGLNGKSIRFGNGIPSDADGQDDEIYLDLSNFKVHSKAAGTWGAGQVFRGNDGNNGNNGADGKAIYTTTSIASGVSPAPNVAYSTTQGGDVLVDTVNHKIYRRSASGATFSWIASGGTFKGTSFKGAFATATGLDGNEGDTAIINNVIHKHTGGSWTSQSTSVKGDQGDVGPTGPGLKVYSVALGSDASASDVALTTSFTDMYLADVMTDEGSILTATSTRGSTTEFTISSAGRYKIDIQASTRAINYNASSGYNPTVTIRILNSSTDTILLDSTMSLSMSAAASPMPGVVIPKVDSDVLNIVRSFKLSAGAKIKIQAKTDSTSVSPVQKTYLQLATDAESPAAADTVVTFTKL